MTSVHLNPPPSAFLDVELNDEQQLQLFVPPHQASASPSLQPPLFNSTTQQFRTVKGKLAGSLHQYDLDHHHQVDEYTTPIKRSNGHNKLLSTSLLDAETSHVRKCCKREEHSRDQLEGTSRDGSIKWMPIKMKLDEPENHSSTCSKTVKKVRLTVKFQDHHQYHSKECNSACSTNSTRVCSDCNTTTTPLWRSGPQGPKSLCNACGIRQRKARRAMAAMAAAANGGVIAEEASSIKTEVLKEKKSCSSHVGHCKKVCNKPIDYPQPSFTSQKHLCFKNFAKSLSKNSALQQVFPRDVEEAAVLLMELSCGFSHC